MHQAVELLLKRMESNPEEFSGDSHDRWMRHLKRYEDFLSDEEREAIQTKQREIMMTRMHKDIMSELLYGDEQRQEDHRAMVEAASKSLTNSLVFSPSPVTGFPVNNTIAMQADTMTLGGEPLDKETLKQLKALLTQPTIFKGASK
jgi:hypothetical protein